MAGNIFGKFFRITTFGESHGPGLGVVIDGCPAGLALSESDLLPFMARRRPGQNRRTTARNESDAVEILSGVFEGRTTGTPIAILIRNQDQHSSDYSEIAKVFRPGHADFGYYEKYGFRDYRGGGRSSGRETAARVAAGAVAEKLLNELGITVEAEVSELAGINLLEEDGKERAYARIEELRHEGDSAGGQVLCRINGVKPGIGEPVFDKLDARLASAVMSIGAVKAVEIGDGISVKDLTGTEDNDAFVHEDGAFHTRTNHSGGILGGISDGDEIIVRASFKPTPSVSSLQETTNEDGENLSIQIKGRHDPTVVERASVVVECMCALTLIDSVMENCLARIENLRKVYQE